MEHALSHLATLGDELAESESRPSLSKGFTRYFGEGCKVDGEGSRPKLDIMPVIEASSKNQ